METLGKVLEQFESILGSGGTELWLKAILMVASVIGSAWWAIKKRKARKKSARDQAERDRQRNRDDNIEDENQNKEDGQSVRDRLRGEE